MEGGGCHTFEPLTVTLFDRHSQGYGLTRFDVKFDQVFDVAQKLKLRSFHLFALSEIPWFEA
jgi:hypothetical protein